VSIELPIINEDKCPANSCATEAEGGPVAPSLDLRPGQALLCVEATLVFRTYLMSAAGETQLTLGVTYSTSDASILAIDSESGAATVTGSGIVTITASWGDLTAFSQITVLEPVGEDCCADTQVRIVVVGDESLSMQIAWAGLGDRRRNAAYQILRRGLAGALVDPAVLSERTKAATVLFSQAALLYQAFTDDPSVVIYPASVPGTVSPGDTDIVAALNEALEVFTTDPVISQQIIILFSDGRNRPSLTSAERTLLIGQAQAFKEGGGVIIVFGVGATSEGFDLLRQISSGGFFINLLELNDAAYDDAADKLTHMLCLLCAGTRPTTGYTGSVYTYGCADFDNGPQVPDSHDYGDVESGVQQPNPPPLPQLPCPTFSPGDGTHVGGGITVRLAVTGFPAASIRFTSDTDPADPSFTFPSAGATGLDYDGSYFVDGISVSVTGVVKAIARQTGYADSPVCSANYPA
jgi:hypothetical protein